MSCREAYRWTKLGVAAYYGRADVTRVLLGESEVEFLNTTDRRQLEVLAEKVTKLPACDPDEIIGDGYSALIVAARRGHLDVCRALLEHGAAVNLSYPVTGETALAIAIENVNVELVSLLLSHGADVQTRDNVKTTPLYMAVRRRNRCCVERLLDHRADPDLGSQDHTPLFLAARLGLLQIAKLLIKAGCNLNVMTKHGMTPLHEACTKGQTRMVEYLIEQGCDVNRADSEGHSPLYSAARTGLLHICQLLIQAGADLRCVTANGESPLDAALSNGRADVAEFLLRHGMSICSPGECTSSVREMIAGNHRDSAAVLLQWCSDLDLRGCLGQSYYGMYGQPSKNVFWNDSKLLRMLILSGMKGGRTIPIPTSHPRCPHEIFLHQSQTSPLSLKEISRISVRRSLGNLVIARLELLPLPRSLKNYVALKEL